ncbi:MAG TPA: diacylglycerol kinase [Thermoleophilia bacterium]
MSPNPQRDTLLRSFNHALQGLVHSVRHQRNMRIHFGVALAVLVGGLFADLSRLEFVAVAISIAFVLMAELINTAIEAVVDIITDEFDPRAKVAKDVAAGAVLVASMSALVVAYLVFFDKLAGVSLHLLTTLRRSPVHLTVVALAVVALAVITVKATRPRGTPLSGGLPSGHTAIGFAGWTAVTFVAGGTSQGLLLSAIAFIMAALVAQSRIETGIHSAFEVVLGALLGIAVTTLIFQLWF